ncbi:MAG: GGDEF domain-containing protein [Proteobacteria bacterium]|nr:GGDEF domain-containing protein [Pseudomonadota bacterium]
MSEVTVETSSERLRMALPLMAKNKVPVTPENYWVWYQYISGENLELKETIDRLLAQNKPVDEVISQALFRRYIEAADHAVLSKAEGSIRKLVDGMSSSLQSADSEVSRYEASLDECFEELSDDMSADHMKNLIRALTESTKRMHEGSASLHTHLEQSREEVKLLKQELRHAKTMAKTDPMTGLANRVGFKESLDELRSQQDAESVRHSLLIADIDKFKNVNDTYGHVFGDKIIKVVANALDNLAKGKDIVARFGGEEFIVVLPETGIKGGLTVSESIRKNIESGRIYNPKTKQEIERMTISIGVTEFNINEQIEAVIERADAALYRAKEGGRNRV